LQQSLKIKYNIDKTFNTKDGIVINTEYYGKMKECRLGQSIPNGWLRELLICQRDGMPGHLDEIGYPFDTSCWGFRSLTDGGYEEWWPYEQTGYFIDSMVRLSAVLKDRAPLNRVLPQIKKALDSAKEDGFIGPGELKSKKSLNQWPHAVFFRALFALWSNEGDQSHMDALIRHYLSGYGSYGESRDIVNIETMLNLYAVSGDERLKTLAVKSYEDFNKNSSDDASSADSMLSDEKPYQHGVTYNEQAKLAAIMYMHTGIDKYLDAAVNAYEKIEKYFMLPDGVHSSCEFTLGNDSLQAHETCDISDYTWSIGYMLMATGNAEYADRIERACFNAAPGVIGPYFRTIQYFSSVNQVVALRNSCHTSSFEDTPRFAFQPHHYPECCVGNVGRTFPNYGARMYMETDGGVALALYGDSTYTGEEISLTQTGGYPFNDTVTVCVDSAAKEPVSISLRLPGWCDNPSVLLNSEPVKYQEKSGFAVITRQWEKGDRLTLIMPMEPKSHKSPEDGIYITVGPFLMSLKIEEEWTVDKEEKRQTAEFPAFSVRPQSPWNYALSSDVLDHAVLTEGNIGKNPFWDGIPFSLCVPARCVDGWAPLYRSIQKNENPDEELDDTMVSLGATRIMQELELTPPLPDNEYTKEHSGKKETVTLVPYGCTHLRISVFPTIAF